MLPARVLVADDSRIFRLLVSEVLRDRGIAVVEASNGREALDQTLSERPELLILDASPLCPGSRARKLKGAG
jgi:two-component system KDP operon response regulator KdpE